MNNSDYESYKIHWKRRSTEARETCFFDKLLTAVMVLYIISGAVWILNDAFPNLFF